MVSNTGVNVQMVAMLSYTSNIPQNDIPTYPWSEDDTETIVRADCVI